MIHCHTFEATEVYCTCRGTVEERGGVRRSGKSRVIGPTRGGLECEPLKNINIIICPNLFIAI